MKVSILDVPSDGDKLAYKDWAGGFGTKFIVGDSLQAKFLEFCKKNGAVLPQPVLGYAVAIFRKKGHTVSVDSEICSDADLILMPVSTVCHREEMEAAEKIKKETKAKLGMFGTFATARPDIFSGKADFVVKGEPEDIFLRLSDGEEFKGVVESRPVDLDSLPFPDWDSFDVKKFSYFPSLKNRPVLPILGSRGCVYKCNYCPYLVGYKWRFRSAKNIVDEIEYLIERYKVKGLIFRDPLFTSNLKTVHEIADEIKKRGIKIDWACETRLDHLNEQLIDILYGSGLRSINVGIESVNHEILKNSKRIAIPFGHQEKIIRYCDKKGIHITGFYVIGLPDDTRENILSTIEYAKKLNTHVASFTIITPYPGTEHYELTKERIYDADWNNYNGFTPVWKHDNLSAKELLELKERAFLSYYFRPEYTLSFIRRLLQ
ncbi:Radical SAM superfamily protein [uncultured archaeon]|nr:Radical SAM superfamily protein [uncultured archaeon]